MNNWQKFFITSSVWGKLFGGFFGYLIGHSLGAMIGIFIGNFFDRGLSEHFLNPQRQYHQEKRKYIQQIFFKITFATMGYVAKADGNISIKEIQVAMKIMDEMHLSTHEKEIAKDYFRQGKQPQFNLTSMLYELLHSIRDNPELLRLFMDIQYRAAVTSHLSSSKINALNKVFTQLGFAPLHRQTYDYHDFNQYYHGSSNQYDSFQRKTTQNYDNLEAFYTVLGVPLEATRQEVKRAYRRLISRHHPDKLIAQGLPETMIKLANEKTQRITKAYETICQQKGWSRV